MGPRIENKITINLIKSSALTPSFDKTSNPPYHNSTTPIITPKLSVTGADIKSRRALFNKSLK